MAKPDFLIPKVEPEAKCLKICLTGQHRGVFYMDAILDGRPVRLVPIFDTLDAANALGKPIRLRFGFVLGVATLRTLGILSILRSINYPALVVLTFSLTKVHSICRFS